MQLSAALCHFDQTVAASLMRMIPRRRPPVRERRLTEQSRPGRYALNLWKFHANPLAQMLWPVAPQSKGNDLKMTKLKEEFFKILPPTIYFFVALHLVMFVRVLMLEGTGLSPYSSASIARHCPGSRQSSVDRGHAAVDQSFS